MRRSESQPGRRHDSAATRLPAGGVAARLAFVLVVAMAGVAAGAEIVALDLSGVRDGVYVLRINGGVVTLTPLTLIPVNGPAPKPEPKPDPTPSRNPYTEPVGNLLTAAREVAAVKMERADATSLAKLYEAAMRLVESAQAARAAGVKPEIDQTDDLRRWLVENGKPLGLSGKYAGLADAVDAFLGSQLGTEIRPVADADAVALSALAWGIWEAGR